MPPRRSPRLNKILPEYKRPDLPKNDKNVPPPKVPLISRHTINSVRAQLGHMEGLIFGNEAQISKMKSDVAKLESSGRNMEMKFETMMESERQERNDAIDLVNLQIIGLNHKHEVHKKKTDDCLKNLYVGQKKIFEAVEELAGASGNRARVAAGRMDQDLTGIPEARQTRLAKCEPLPGSSGDSNST